MSENFLHKNIDFLSFGLIDDKKTVDYFREKNKWKLF